MDISRYTVRPFTEADLTAKGSEAVMTEAWEDIYSGYRSQLGDELFGYFYGDYRLRVYSDFKRDMTSCSANGLAFTVIDSNDGSTAAMGCGRISVRADIPTGHIGINAVRRDLWRNGIGSFLQRTILSEMKARGAEFAQARTGYDDAHTAARRSYESAGFTHITPHTNYYRDNSKTPAASSFTLPDNIVIRRPQNEAEIRRMAEMSVEVWQPIWDSTYKMLGHDIFHSIGDRRLNRYNETCNMCSDGRTNAYLMLVGDDIAAYCSWRVENAPGGKYGAVLQNGVSSAFKGRGLGLVMQNCIVHDMLGTGLKYARVTTGLDDGHIPARKTYERSGFCRSIPFCSYYKQFRTL